MKTETKLLIREISGSHLEKLTFEVKETIAVTAQKKVYRNFTVAQLWKVHNMKRAIPSRRYF